MYQEYFGLKNIPFGKNNSMLCMHGDLINLQELFNNSLKYPGIGLLTGEPGVGKTAALHNIIKSLNPHQYSIIYLAETQFTSCDIYRQIALNLGLVPAYRFAQLWRDIKNHIRDRVEHKRSLPVFIIDEAQNLPGDFFKSFPSFLNFDFDAKDMMTVWFVGHPILSSVIDRVAYIALATRIQFRCQIQPITDRNAFIRFFQDAFKEAGCQTTLLSDSGIEIIRIASQGRFRNVHRILTNTMQLAMHKKLNHFPDEIIQEAISLLKG
jgi:type II secretory pathway predicted ATPase ExeA